MAKNTFAAEPKREMISRTFHLDIGQLEPLKRISQKLGISQSEMIRRSIELFMEEFERRSHYAK